MTAGIFLPSFGFLMPSRIATGLPLPAVYRKQAQNDGQPEAGEPVEIDSVAVEEGEQAVVGFWLKIERSDETGDTGKIGEHRESHENKHEPLKGSEP